MPVDGAVLPIGGTTGTSYLISILKPPYVPQTYPGQWKSQVSNWKNQIIGSPHVVGQVASTSGKPRIG